MAEHSRLAPSSYGRLAYCRAAPSMEYAYPGEDTPAAKEGRAAHRVAEANLTNGEYFPDGSLAEGVEVTQEMREAAEMYAGDIRNVLGERGRPILEQQISLAGLHPEAFGTPDAVARYPKHLYLWDFKYGHAYVDAFENWQLIAYSFPFVDALSPQEELDTTVTMTIVQPRSFHPDGPVRRWVVKASELRAYYNTLRGWLNEAMAPDVEAEPHPTACLYCSARGVCKALRNAAYHAMDFSGSGSAEMHRLEPSQLGVELARVKDLGKLLEAYGSGIEEEVEGALRAGVAVPHWTMAPGQSRLEWDVPQEMLESFGEAVWQPRKPITPTQARDRKVLSPELLDAYTRKPPAPLKLTRVDHKLAKRLFK